MNGTKFSGNISGNNDRLRARCSSRENTLSSMSIDFDKMENKRDEEISDYSKLVSQGSMLSRIEDQRRRLESFLCLAQQAKSKKDIVKIQDMIRQIDETGKPLPMSRINELKLLELMASPYNQSLIAMIKVELDIAKKVKEMKKLQLQKEQTSKSKFSLPKHLVTNLSRGGVVTEESTENLDDPNFEVARVAKNEKDRGLQSDNRLTTVVDIKTIGIASCRNFIRSPGRMSRSPLSQGVQPMLSGKSPNDQSASKRDSSRKERYSYLRSVGNAVVVN